jgi:hypothetical protein
VSFADLVSTAYRVCLNTLGQSYNYTSQTPGATPITVTGKLTAGAELEPDAPGAGSVNAILFVHATDISPAPANGDEIASATTVYKIVQVLQDSGDRIALHLRQDRMVTP